MGGRGEVLDQEEALDVRRGGLRKVLPVFEERNLERFGGNLDDDMRGTFVFVRGAEAAVLLKGLKQASMMVDDSGMLDKSFAAFAATRRGFRTTS